MTARDSGIASPLIDVCHALFSETMSLGLEGDDVISVIRAIEQRTASIE
jgi:3-hydroxyisobutyrate dehydrogenase